MLVPFSKDWISTLQFVTVFLHLSLLRFYDILERQNVANIAQLVERHAVVLEVTGSNPVIRFRQVAEWYTRR